MVEKKQSSGLISQFQSTDGGMVKDGMPDHTEVETQIMGDDGPNDVRVRHKDIWLVRRIADDLFHGRNGAMLHLSQRLAAGWARHIRLGIPVSLRRVIRELLPVAIDPMTDPDLTKICQMLNRPFMRPA